MQRSGPLFDKKTIIKRIHGEEKGGSGQRMRHVSHGWTGQIKGRNGSFEVQLHLRGAGVTRIGQGII